MKKHALKIKYIYDIRILLILSRTWDGHKRTDADFKAFPML